MTYREKMKRAIVLMDMAIELMEEVEADLSQRKVQLKSIKEHNGHIEVEAEVK